MYLESNSIMQLKTREENGYLFCFDEEEKKSENGQKIFIYEAIRTPLYYTYDLLVSLIIREKYSDDKMQAVINNFLLENDNTEHEEEFKQMQSWRKHAKEIAKQILEH